MLETFPCAFDNDKLNIHAENSLLVFFDDVDEQNA